MSAVTDSGQLLAAGTWRVDPTHSALEFRVKHLMIETVSGRFLDFDGAIEAGDQPSIVGSVRTASLETHDEERDAHLRSSDFFDVEHHPEILFASTSVDLTEDGVLVVTGALTIRGVTQPIELVGRFEGTGLGQDGSERIAFDLRGRVNRLDYGLTWNRMLETGGILVGNVVELSLAVAAVRDVAVERAA